MPSAKRRRGIGIKKWIVAALKERAKADGCKSHTSVATKIWLGKADPLEKGCRKHKADSPEGSQGVSMREEIWLALKVYAERRGNGESAQKVANMILVGKIPSLPYDSIIRGRMWANERENDRLKEAKSSRVDDPNPSSKPKAKAKKKPKAKAKVEPEVEQVLDVGLEPEIDPEPPIASERKTKSEEIVEERESEREERERSFGRRKRKLSEGSPLDPGDEERRERSLTHDVEILGGVFNL